MDDREFDEKMREYARSTAKGMEHDLSKTNVVTATPQKKTSRKGIVAVCSIVLIVAICLAVALPLTLNQQQGDGGQGNYFADDEQINDIPFESLADITEYTDGFMLPTIENISDGGALEMDDTTNEFAGIYLELCIIDDYFDTVYISMYKEGYTYASEFYYEGLPYTTEWNGVDVGYVFNSTVNNFGSHYECRMTFTIDAVNYYLRFDFYGEPDACEILDMLYS